MVELYEFQKEAVEDLITDKRICVLPTGCLAGDTPVPMADGSYKLVRDMKGGEVILSYNEDKGEFVENTVDKVIRTCHKPKPMIELEYDGEKITTTYDHPFFNGEGYYPIYQLVWGALEESERVQLKLLCEQYGTPFDDKAIWCKYCGSNEAVKGRQWLLQDNDRRAYNQATQNSSRELVEEPRKIALCKSPKWEQSGQQGGELGMVFSKIQRLVWLQQREHQATNIGQQQEDTNKGTEEIPARLLREEHQRSSKLCESKALRLSANKVSEHIKKSNTQVGDWKARVKVSEPYYTISMCQAPYTYCVGRRHYYLTHNSGKSAVMMTWLKSTGRENVLILTTPSKQRSGDFERDADTFCGDKWRTSLYSFEVLSWAKLHRWWHEFILGRTREQLRKELDKWAIAFDEVAYAKNGVSSQRGKAFLQITELSSCWTGYTATPGDNWLQFYPYFQATKLTKNKTAFKREFAVEQTYPFPKIVKWLKQDRLVEMWNMISTRPDSSSVMGQLPKENYKTITFKPSADYKNALKTRHTADGEFLDSNMALMHYIRQACWTNQKKEWLHDFIENLETGAVVFFTYTKEGDDICEMVKKLGRKAWRIDGKHHQIPTKDTIGEKDIVVCQWQSGAEALNLQFMNYWVSVSPQYSYTTYTQALGRIKRIGQELPMFFYFMKTEKSIEADIYKALGTKRDFSEDTWLSDNNLTEA